MSDLVDAIFGGEDDSAQRQNQAQNAQKLALFESLGRQARGDALNLSPVADANRNLGFGAALQALQQGAGQSIDAFQGGNVGAQNTLLAGLPQQNNAILGLPTDLSGLQAQQIQFDPSFLNQQLPDFQSTSEVLPGSNQQATDLLALLQAAQGNTEAGGTQASNAFFNPSSNAGNNHGTAASDLGVAGTANAIGNLQSLFGQGLNFAAMPVGTGFVMNQAGNSDIAAAQETFSNMSVAQQAAAVQGMSPAGLAAMGLGGVEGNLGAGGGGSDGPGPAAMSAQDIFNQQFAQGMTSGLGATGGEGIGSGDPGFGGEGQGASGGDKIICTELYNQGYMDYDTWRADEEFGRTVDQDIIDGYHMWAEPWVEVMKKSPLATKITWFVVRPWTEHMAYEMGARDKGNIIGRMLWNAGSKVCRMTASRKVFA